MKLEKEIKSENFQEIEDRGKRLEALMNLSKKIRDQERRLAIPFNDFLYLASTDPENFFRDIFQLFHDMVHFYMPEGVEEYPESQNSVGFVGYDSSKLFVEGQDNPFFADRLFANRLMNLVEGFKSGNLKNHIFLFEGPPGSGKSTFLNNILLKLEEYTRTKEGTIYKTYWRLDIERLGGFPKFQGKLFENTQDTDIRALSRQMAATHLHYIERPQKYLQFSCPRHDHPVLQIPKSYRKEFLDELVPDEEFKEKLFHKKEYEWVMKDIPCNICKSLFTTLLDILGDPLEVFNMLTARKAVFNRQFGEGISIFNPGDPPANKPITNETLQKMINNLLKTDNIDFIYSTLAKTNNGVLALMDIKENNIDRLNNLHGIISDGVHKVELIEEHIKSLFLGILNPEDRVHFENVESFRDRIITVNINYILDFNTEVSIYKNKFGRDIEKVFLPRVLENFAKIIISSRMDTDSKVIQNWLKDGEKYKKYQDKNYLLLKMDIYTGKIPDWLSDDDLKRFDKPTRRAVLATSEKEGKSGFSGRMSLNIFNEFYSKMHKNGGLINMEDVQKYFIDNEDLYAEIPKGFIT